MTLGKGYERCIFSLVSYMISGVFLANLIPYYLHVESGVLEALRKLDSFIS